MLVGDKLDYTDCGGKSYLNCGWDHSWAEDLGLDKDGVSSALACTPGSVSCLDAM